MGAPAGWITEVPDLSYQAQWKAIGNGVFPRQGVVALRDMLAAINYQEEMAA